MDDERSPKSHPYFVPDYFLRFACKIGTCRTACCVGWPVSISQENYFRLLGVDCSTDLRRRLAAKQLDLAITDAARDHIIDTAYDPIYGARPLKRFIQSKIETLLARKIIGEDLAPDTTLTVDVADGRLVVR